MAKRKSAVSAPGELAGTDGQPYPGVRLDDLDPELIENYRSEARERRPNSDLAGLPTDELLTRIGAAIQGDDGLIPSLTGILFFAPDPQRFFPSLTITFLHFASFTIGPAGRDAPIYLDNREFRGPIPAMIQAARSTIFQQVARPATITSFRRREVPEYPEVAVREAIVNAVAHRDYSRHGSSIQIRLFADRLEIQSPGGLPAGLTVENLAYEQYTRNPRIMRLLEDLGYVERRGLGIDTMIASMTASGLPSPEFEDRSISFWVTLRGPASIRAHAEYVRMGLNERQIQALDVIRTRGQLSNRDYQDLFQVAERTALYDLSDLVERGILLPVSSGRGRHYILRD